jgi:16S rRNA (guanine966-N2)-methyltransferase
VSLRILGGLAKGLLLHLPNRISFRPTSVMLRRKMFDAFQQWEGKIFIDACAGSGAMGLEAWSRGALEVILVENEKRNHLNVEKSVDKFVENFPQECEQRKIKTVQLSFDRWWARFEHLYAAWPMEKKKNTLFFWDPPYAELEHYWPPLEKIFHHGQYVGELWIESDRQKGFSSEQLIERVSSWKNVDLNSLEVFTQGTNFILRVPFRCL